MLARGTSSLATDSHDVRTQTELSAVAVARRTPDDGRSFRSCEWWDRTHSSLKGGERERKRVSVVQKLCSNSTECFGKQIKRVEVFGMVSGLTNTDGCMDVSGLDNNDRVGRVYSHLTISWSDPVQDQ